MLAFTTLKSFLYLKFLKISTLNLAPTLIRKMIYTIYFFFLSLLFSLKRTLGSRSFHPFTSFRIHHSSLSRILACSQILSLSFVRYFFHSSSSFFLTRHLVQTHFEARKLSIDATVSSICLDSLDLSQKNSFNNISLFFFSFFFFFLFNPRVPFF